MVDTSALVELFTVDAGNQGEALTERLVEMIPHPPDIVDVEFHHALRGQLLANKVSRERADLARGLFADTPIQRFPTRSLMGRVWALQHNLGAYDACFIALAEVLEVPLITCDEKQKSASGHQARVDAF